LQAHSEAQQHENDRMKASAGQDAVAAFQGHKISGLTPNLDPVKIATQIYPIMVSCFVYALLNCILIIICHEGIPRSNRYLSRPCY
jgi:hypothetical protein